MQLKKRVAKVLTVCLVVSFLLFGTTIAWSGEPDKMPQPTREDTCPVCGMFVYKYPEWIAAVVFKNGDVYFFDGAKDMFKLLHDPQNYGTNHQKQDIDSISVTDYYDLERFDARKAFYVIGSDVYGPMGHELIPLKNRADAEGFLKDHQGKQIVSFQEITPALIQKIDEGY